MRGLGRATWLIGIALLTAACSAAPSSHPFHPTGASLAASPSSVPAATPAADGLTWPPFGHNVRIIMPGWQPRRAAEAPAVTAGKNFLLAMLYAEYRGDRDRRWRSYVGPQLRGPLAAQLAQPDVTTQSFKGTIRFSHLNAFPDPSLHGAVDVSQCFDNSHSVNTSITTGRPVRDRTPADQHYYLTTNVLEQTRPGLWQVVRMYPPVYYPRAPECKP